MYTYIPPAPPRGGDPRCCLEVTFIWANRWPFAWVHDWGPPLSGSPCWETATCRGLE